ncbi:MAG: folylpolyglutamate synthase/dihydrofolate synthase family protein [Corynebacterium sp.]|nr:folylpolyglutamate synthase/dihydrofolate synthase family protein [Corynebacterium sp.]
MTNSQEFDEQEFDESEDFESLVGDSVTLDESGLTLNLGLMAGEEKDTTPNTSVSEDDRRAYAALEAELSQRGLDTDPNPTLERLTMAMDVLGAPHEAFTAIQIAGTNGKTSTARMVDSLLRAFHRRVGLFVSPHMQHLTESIIIDGQEISIPEFLRIHEEISPYLAMVDQHFVALGQEPMTRFEVLVTLAYAAFADAPVEIAVIEAGMGGTWDATNVTTAEIAAVTPIASDHRAMLGETLAEIAGHKAGIIKSRQERDEFAEPAENIAIIAKQSPEALQPLLARAVEVGAGVARQGIEFDVATSAVAVGGQVLTLRGLSGTYNDIFLPLSGEHQAFNASVALAVVEAFFGAHSDKQLDAAAVRTGFAQVKVPGRLERFGADPVIFVDSAHNPHGMESLAKAIERDFNFTSLVGVVGVLADKDAAEMLRQLEPVLSHIVVTEPASPRALPADELAKMAYDIFGDERVYVSSDLLDALDQAIVIVEEAEEDGQGIVVTGSIVTAGQARAMLATRAE